MTAATREIQPSYTPRLVRNVRVPMPDGVTLAADLVMPHPQAGSRPGCYPALLEYLPYRKNDTNQLASLPNRYFAERGFVKVHLDVRGTGDAEGRSIDEYSMEEQLDAVHAIAWIAEQPWCTGKVGMYGMSYGGFNSIQVATHRPPALKAIVPMYFTDRRYTDDCHYKGGALQLFADAGLYGMLMAGRNLLPPRPDLVGDKWAAIWAEQLNNEPWILLWLAHQTEDEQWLNGSLFTDYSSIQAATFMIGGWRDGYMNPVLRCFQHLQCPRKALIGPWMHTQPYLGFPGPRLDNLREAARWFAHWLRDEDTGILDEPPITLYVQRYDPPDPVRLRTSGSWRHETEWPLARGRSHTLHLAAAALSPLSGGGRAAGRLGEGQGEGGDTPPLKSAGRSSTTSVSFDHVPTVGLAWGVFSIGTANFLPADQRDEEIHSAVFTTEPLTEPLEVVGYPHAILHVSSTAPVVTFCARLCDVAPDGSSALVTRGILNATHRESHSDPTPIEPGRVYELDVELDCTAWLYEPGHRIRLSVSNADFPTMWPTPYLATSQIHVGPDHPSRLVLPVAPPDTRDLPAPAHLEPPDPATHFDRPWRVTRDLMHGTAEVHLAFNSRTTVDPGYDTEVDCWAAARASDRDPARASITGHQTMTYRWPDRTIRMQSHVVLDSDPTTIHASVHVSLTMDGQPHFSRHWLQDFPRRLL